MVFNWFRRQYSESKSSEQEATPEQPQDEPAKSAPIEPETDATDESSPAVAEDYLNWAKAAYKNIKKQQKPETEVSETAAPEVTA
ncbi:MAG: signal recognition particle-docking protein FtsY, partial [Microcoleus sp. Co-bin12]|nr:signal recognition particle-docking protein FtsY [Microcoleus sp. Co-bin12]